MGTAVIFDEGGRKWSDIRETTSFPWIEGTLYIGKLDSVFAGCVDKNFPR